MDTAGYYKALATKRANIMNECIIDANTFALQVTSHNSLKDFEKLLAVIPGEERVIFIQACREYQYSLEAVLYGHYRHAFSSLRLSLELFTGAVYFSAHQMKLRLWMQGSDDLFWSTITDPDKGVYSHDFMKAYSPSLGPYRNQYMNLSSAVYRECSEYVHGNPTTHEDASLIVSFDDDKFKDFHDKVATVRLCILFQFASRYLAGLSSDSRNMIEHIVVEAFGDLPEVQAIFEEAQA